MGTTSTTTAYTTTVSTTSKSATKSTASKPVRRKFFIKLNKNVPTTPDTTVGSTVSSTVSSVAPTQPERLESTTVPTKQLPRLELIRQARRRGKRSMSLKLLRNRSRGKKPIAPTKTTEKPKPSGFRPSRRGSRKGPKPSKKKPTLSLRKAATKPKSTSPTAEKPFRKFDFAAPFSLDRFSRFKGVSPTTKSRTTSSRTTTPTTTSTKTTTEPSKSSEDTKTTTESLKPSEDEVEKPVAPSTLPLRPFKSNRFTFNA